MAEESDLHRTIRKDVISRGGVLRKCQWVMRNGAPDTLIWVPGGRPFWAELKAEDEEPKAHQAREHDRMRKEGHLVFVVHNLLEYRRALHASEA